VENNRRKKKFYIRTDCSVREILAELLGSMFLVMAAISPIVLFTSVLESSIGIAVLATAITVAFVLFALIEIFGPISGAHFNPIVTIIMILEKKISPTKAAFYIPIQFAGGIIGMLLSHLMFQKEVGGMLFVSDVARNDYAYPAEVIGTFILVLAILILVRTKSSRISIIVGLLVAGMLMSTSSTMFANPQVTVARMFTNTAAGIRPIDGLVFIAMQTIGAILAYGVYKIMFRRKTSKEEAK